MPKLPSGRQVGIRGFTPAEIIKKISEEKGNVSPLVLGGAIAELNTREAILPYVRVLFARQSGGTSKTPLHEGSLTLPDGLELYDSGLTLAEQGDYDSDWSETDRHAFQEFLNSSRTSGYFDHLFRRMTKASELFRNGVYELLLAVSGEVTFDDDELACDDYDLLVALCIFADLEEPQEDSKRDLWCRMNAVRRHWVTRVPVLGDLRADLENPRELSSTLRSNGGLERAGADREWLHKQNVVFANDLFNLYDPEELKAINCQAYQIVTVIALSEPTR